MLGMGFVEHWATLIGLRLVLGIFEVRKWLLRFIIIVIDDRSWEGGVLSWSRVSPVDMVYAV